MLIVSSKEPGYYMYLASPRGNTIHQQGTPDKYEDLSKAL
jgi:hypothetical protein